jgi:hypothetical protein
MAHIISNESVDISVEISLFFLDYEWCSNKDDQQYSPEGWAVTLYTFLPFIPFALASSSSSFT